MAEVIEFPAGPEFDRRQIERELEKLLEGKEPEYAESARNAIARILDAYGPGHLPPVNVPVVVPQGLDHATAVALAADVCTKYKNALAPFVQGMLLDLVRAELTVCNYKFQHK